MNIFEAESVSKTYSNHVALTDVSLKVPGQSIFGLLGPNGAGKTTFLRIINQILAPDKGYMYFAGEKLTAKHVERIGYLPEERGLYKKMKVGEQAIYLAQLKGLSQKEATNRLKKLFNKYDLGGWWNRKVEELSKGMQQKVQFIVTIIHQPELLIFDEPFSGFDPINVNLLKDEILELKENGATIIFSTHNMASVEELCDHIALIDKSKKILEGNVNGLKQKFKTGTFEVILNGRHQLDNDELPSGYQLKSTNLTDGHTYARITLPVIYSPNELIGFLIEKYELLSFNEVMPTMNEIFIEQVKKNK